MTPILIDTSVWGEYWKAKSDTLVNTVDTLLFEGNVACCYPIKAEIASAQIEKKYLLKIMDGLNYAIVADLDYKDEHTWLNAAKLAQEAYQHKIPPCGLIDRIILLCAMKHHLKLWTLDTKLTRLATLVGANFSPD